MKTIRDVAAMAGVSPATVSRILSGDESFSVRQETRKAVFDAVKKMGYIPYVNKKTRSRQSSAHPKNVGCVTTSAFGNKQYDPGTHHIFQELKKELDLRDISLFHLAAESEIIAEPERFFPLNCDAVVIMANIDRTLYRCIREGTKHIISVNSYFPEIDNITYDKERSAASVVQHLVDLGHRRIAYIGGPGILKQDLRTSRRFAGFRVGLMCSGLLPDERLEKNCLWLSDRALAQTKELLSLDQPPDAVICGSDNIVFPVYRAIMESGLRIPEDIAVASCGQLPISEYCSPTLTTVQIPVHDITVAAADMLVRRMDGYDAPPREIVFSSSLLIRESTDPGARDSG